MQQAQVITYGIGGGLADRLRELAQTQRFWLRETSQFSACRSLVQASPPSVFVIVLGRDLERRLDGRHDIRHSWTFVAGAKPCGAVDLDQRLQNPQLEGSQQPHEVAVLVRIRGIDVGIYEHERVCVS